MWNGGQKRNPCRLLLLLLFLLKCCVDLRAHRANEISLIGILMSPVDIMRMKKVQSSGQTSVMSML